MEAADDTASEATDTSSAEDEEVDLERQLEEEEEEEVAVAALDGGADEAEAVSTAAPYDTASLLSDSPSSLSFASVPASPSMEDGLAIVVDMPVDSPLASSSPASSVLHRYPPYPALEQHRAEEAEEADVDEEEDGDFDEIRLVAPRQPRSDERQKQRQQRPEQEVPPAQQQQQQLPYVWWPWLTVPLLLVSTNVLTAVGSGLTIRYLTLFFIQDYGFSPVKMALCQLAAPLTTSLMSMGAQRISRRIGRVRAIFLTRALGTVSLFLFSFLRPAALLVPLYVARAAFMNCSAPLRRSILMDSVPKEQRTKWNSIEGLTRFNWAASAVLGGLIVDYAGYRTLFFATACFYILGALPVLLLDPLVPRELPEVLAVERVAVSTDEEEEEAQTQQQQAKEKERQAAEAAAAAATPSSPSSSSSTDDNAAGSADESDDNRTAEEQDEGGEDVVIAVADDEEEENVFPADDAAADESAEYHGAGNLQLPSRSGGYARLEVDAA